jgi:hypothetical protein
MMSVKLELDNVLQMLFDGELSKDSEVQFDDGGNLHVTTMKDEKVEWHSLKPVVHKPDMSGIPSEQDELSSYRKKAKTENALFVVITAALFIAGVMLSFLLL